MSVLRTITTAAFSLALVGMVFSTGAKADEWNNKTVLTFSAPCRDRESISRGGEHCQPARMCLNSWTRRATATSSRSSTRKRL